MTLRYYGDLREVCSQTKKIMKKKLLHNVLALLLVLYSFTNVSGQVGCHDPSSIIECDGTYYMFGTGDGIAMVSSSSTSFSTYTVETSPFVDGNPDWVYDYVSDFEGTYWAPECIYMNNKYYLYYSVSMGDAECAIGLVTTPSLTDPEWTDQGMVVYSDDDTEYGSIDPDVFFDEDDNLWMAFGSHLDGIWLVQLNTSTGKTLNSDFYNIVTSSDAEAAHLEYYDGYYYIFYNQNTCCSGLESDYAIYMGRSTSITGTYYDEDGTSLNDGGGSVFLETDGRYVGPGHFGYGEGVLTYHFYDGNDYGASKLMVSSLSWADGWPEAETLESGGASIPSGTYTITNVNSGLLLDLENCNTDDGTNVQQYEDLDNNCQRWTITEAEDGFYTIQNVNSETLLDVVNCGFESGTNVDAWSDLSNVCQQWRFEEQDDGSYRIVSRKNGKDLEVADADTDNGANVQTYAMNGASCQYWNLSLVKSTITEGTYTLTNRYSGLVLDAEDCSTDNGTNAQQWEDLDNTCQQWTFTLDDDGYYTIENVNSGNMLDVEDCGTDDATNVDLYEDLSNVCQEWYLVYVGEDYYRIINRNSGMNLEVADASTENGANVQMYTNNNNYCQQWSFSTISTDASSFIRFEEEGEGDEDSEVSDITIYPNPVNDNIAITGVDENSSYVIYQLDGTLMLKGVITDSKISVSKLVSAMYILKIELSDGTFKAFNFVKK